MRSCRLDTVQADRAERSDQSPLSLWRRSGSVHASRFRHVRSRKSALRGVPIVFEENAWPAKRKNPRRLLARRRPRRRCPAINLTRPSLRPPRLLSRQRRRRPPMLLQVASLPPECSVSAGEVLVSPRSQVPSMPAAAPPIAPSRKHPRTRKCRAQVPGFDFRADVGQPAELSRSSRRRRRTRGEFTGFWELRKAGLPHAATNGIVQQCGFVGAVFLNKMHAAFGQTRFRDSRGLVAGAF